MYPVVGTMSNGLPVRVTQVRRSHFSPSLLVAFVVDSSGGQVTMLDIRAF